MLWHDLLFSTSFVWKLTRRFDRRSPKVLHGTQGTAGSVWGGNERLCALHWSALNLSFPPFKEPFFGDGQTHFLSALQPSHKWQYDSVVAMSVVCLWVNVKLDNDVQRTRLWRRLVNFWAILNPVEVVATKIMAGCLLLILLMTKIGESQRWVQFCYLLNLNFIEDLLFLGVGLQSRNFPNLV